MKVWFHRCIGDFYASEINRREKWVGAHLGWPLMFCAYFGWGRQ